MTTYSTSKQWLTHMTESHQVQSWLCQHCRQHFQSEDTYRAHLANIPTVKPEHIDVLIELGAGSGPSSCLFCDEVDDDATTMHLHMAEHLRQYALLSLPWQEVAPGTSERESENAIANDGSKGVNSSMLRMEDYKDEVSLPDFRDGHGSDGHEDATLGDSRDNYLRAFVASEKLDFEERQRSIHMWQGALSHYDLPPTSDAKIESSASSAMSGIEAVGLVLGSFSLIISAIEHYQAIEKMGKTFWKLRRQHREDVGRLEDCRLDFRMHMRLLLQPLVVEGTIEQAELELLVEDLSCKGWMNPEIDERLGQRLGEWKKRYFENLKELHGALKRLAKVSRVDDEPFQESLRRKTGVSLVFRSQGRGCEADLMRSIVLRPRACQVV